MKCSKCPALSNDNYEYPEYYCGLGIPDEETIEFADGECGCNRRSADKILKDLKRQEEIENKAWLKDATSFVKFMEQEEKDNAK